MGERFNIMDIDGCEFAVSRAGKLLLSHDEEGKGVLCVYSDASHCVLPYEEAQRRIDKGHWTVKTL